MIRSAAFAAALFVALAATGAVAHPHVWIDARADFVFDRSGRISAVDLRWTFDELYGAFAVRGLDKNRDGKLDSDELAPLIDGMMTNLKSYDYFTFMRADGANVSFAQPIEARATFEKGALTFSFTLPLAEPIDVGRSDISFAMYDPSVYVAIEIADDRSLRLVGSPPAGCASRIVANRPEIESRPLSAVLSRDQDDVPDYAQRVGIACPAGGKKQ